MRTASCNLLSKRIKKQSSNSLTTVSCSLLPGLSVSLLKDTLEDHLTNSSKKFAMEKLKISKSSITERSYPQSWIEELSMTMCTSLRPRNGLVG